MPTTHFHIADPTHNHFVTFVATAFQNGVPKNVKTISQIAPAGVQGSLPTRSAINIWYKIQLSIELAKQNGTKVMGAVSDLTKFFNTIQRE